MKRLGKMVAQRAFAANGNDASDPYQGTTSVVPTIIAGIKGFSPWCFSVQNLRGAQRFVRLVVQALACEILLLGAILAIPAGAQNSPYVQITTSSPLPGGYVGVPYSLVFQATTDPPNQLLSWCVPNSVPACTEVPLGTSASNALPPGLSLNPNGTLSGTPTAAGSYSFTIEAAFATTSPTEAIPATMMFTMTVATSGLSITSASPLPNATLGQPYSLTLTSNANPNTVVWSIGTGGTGLPPGLSLNPNGMISGTATTAGTYSFTVTASISNSAISTSQNFTISVFAGQITITTASLPVAYVGQPYSTTLTASPSNVTWALTAPASILPTGITFNGATGTFSGGTSAAGMYFIQVTATLANYASAVQNYTLYVASQPLQISQTQIPIALQSSAYSVSLTGIGGIPPYAWSMTGNPSTDGLTINAGTGVISGTPTITGNFILSVQLSDVTSAAPATQSLTLQVLAPLSITTASLPVGAPSLPYSQTLSVTGGLPPYSWALAAGSGALPPGLALSPAGVIGGTIAFNATGVYSFTVQVTDSGGRTTTRAFSIAIGAAVTITTPSLLDGVVGVMYSQTLAAGGGTTPYSWALAPGSGALPAGLTLSSAGVISGTPTAAGSSTFTVQVTDSTPGQPLSATRSFTLRIDTPLSITTGNLSATVGVAFSQTLAATGGVPPYVWTISSGSLPAGLSLSAGVISGTPSAAGTATVIFTVADSAGQTATKSITITVNSTANQISITTGNLSATVGVAFSQALAATGGTPPYSWSITSGSLPAGLSLNSGVISGTPTTAGVSTITLLVTDSQNLTASAGITITVNPPQAPSVTVTVGTGTSLGAAQQQPINVSLSSAYSSAITITLSLTFQSSVGGEDQTVQFLTPVGGTQSLTLTVPAGSLAPSATPMLATGTTAGTITITPALSAAGATLPAPAPTVINIPKSSPVITNVTLSNTGGSLTVTVAGYSPTRDMVSGNFTFSPASGSTLTQSEVTVQLGSAFTTWYQNTASYAYGTEFLLTMPFTVSGNAADVTSVAVTLTNSFGTSSAASAQ
jgi:Putative Ig domain